MMDDDSNENNSGSWSWGLFLIACAGTLFGLGYWAYFAPFRANEKSTVVENIQNRSSKLPNPKIKTDSREELGEESVRLEFPRSQSRVNKIAKAMTNDDICGLLEQLEIPKATKKFPLAIFLDAVLSMESSEFSFSESDLASLRALRAGLSDKDTLSRSPEMEFLISARTLTNRLDSVEKNDRLYAEKVIFNRVVQYPENGLYRLMAAFALSERGENANKVRDELKLALQAPEFGSGDLSFRRRVLVNARQNPTKFFMMKAMLDSIAVPSQSKLANMIMDFSKRDSEMEMDVVAWTSERRKDVLDRPSSVYFYESDYFEFALGTETFAKMKRSGRLPASVNSVANDLVPSETLRNPYLQQESAIKQSLFNRKEGAPCDRSALDDFFRLYAEDLK